MTKQNLMTKRVQVDRAQASTVVVIACSVFVTIFSLVSVRTLWSQRGYQARVIGKKQEARDTLNKNVETVKDLVDSYKQFTASSPTNLIGGNPAGTGDKDGDNARIVLDALPSKYDFPALTSSLEKILTDRNFKIGGITGTDDEVAQSSVKESGNPEPVEIPFQISVEGSYSSIQDLVGVFERSIRPFKIQNVTLTGSSENMKTSFEIVTYYQPEKALNIKQETVKWSRKI